MRTRVVTLVVGAILLAGCGGGVEGQAVAGERWDPCVITDDAIADTGLDPSSKDVGWEEGIEVSDWTLCTFRAPKDRQAYFLSVLSSDVHTVEEARHDEDNLNGVDLSLGGRDAFQYETNVSAAVVDCNIAVAIPTGVVLFTVDFAGGVKPTSDPCDLVKTHATDLASQLPPTQK